MRTFVYFVRHAESPYIEGMERSRGLSDRGKSDALKVKWILDSEHIDVFISSPYERAIQTIKESAGLNDILILEDLRERTIGDIQKVGFKEAKLKVYKEKEYSFPDGESSAKAQERAVTQINNMLDVHAGKKIVVGTHGDIMTLIINYFDNRFDFDFWESTSMPDIYKLEFKGRELIKVVRMWAE
ncbi:histidine phosphatase family protein [Paenibacillus thalictri]|uniref:Histidine phosphatase family protein n=1 Tax=Paenibacillus thalictri TaxID=2527873 RepID=A0A4Q9DS71_9BACL|nr:histidine phosphatase family protein [Paenibacillus thalictri]TBL78916.1 histidine phosphatase family protein [Paenibacillus thalictri]